MGFSLIELLIVISILGILTVFGMLRFRDYHLKSHNAAALTDLRNTKDLLTAYYADNKFFP